MIYIFLMNFLFAISTTIGMTIAPILVTEGLGISMLVFGLIEGGTEFFSNILKLVSGNLFDRVKNRKYLFITPSIVNFLSKTLFFFPSAFTITLAKIMERMSNGAFAAPRDAYVGENAESKGIALGFLNMSKTFGCILGPLIVTGVTLTLGTLKENMNIIIALACIINFIGLSFSFALTAPKPANAVITDKLDYTKLFTALKPLILLLITAFFFFLGRFNDGLIILYLKKQGFPEWYYLSAISIFNAVMLLISLFMGYVIDSKKEYLILFLTVVSLMTFNCLFFYIDSFPFLFGSLGLVFWGIQRAGAQITFSAMIFKRISPALYGTAIGVFSVVSGVATFIASLISGYLAQQSFNYVFVLSAGASICALVLTIYMKKKDQTLVAVDT